MEAEYAAVQKQQEKAKARIAHLSTVEKNSRISAAIDAANTDLAAQVEDAVVGTVEEQLESALGDDGRRGDGDVDL